MNMCRDYTQASSPPVGRVTASFQRGGKTKSINRDHMHKGHPGQTRSQYLDKVSWSNFWILEIKHVVGGGGNQLHLQPMTE